MPIPTNTKATLDRYFRDRCPPGRFTRAVLSNDLVGAVFLADSDNRAALIEIVDYVIENAPPGATGSRAAVSNWLRPVETGPSCAD